MKALVISLGTGVSATRKALESLTNALVFSIKTHNPDKAFFVVSQMSQKTTLPKILRKIELKSYETIVMENADDINQICESLLPLFKRVKQQYKQVIIDYTSGTKAMTSALTILGTTFEVDALSYISGKREGGIVLAGTEKLNVVPPYLLVSERKIGTAIQFFNHNQFGATITMLDQIAVTDPSIKKRVIPLRNLAKGYELWDKFLHREAFSVIKAVNLKELDKNKRFLGQLLNASNPELYYVADLINNARRRGFEERRYDDATARLYRTIELIAQYQLKSKFEVQTSAVRSVDLPEELKKKWQMASMDLQFKVGLERAYELLNAKGEPLGVRFVQDKKLRGLLSKRNSSILAHGVQSVDQKAFEELYERTVEYAKMLGGNMDRLLDDSMFIKWNY